MASFARRFLVARAYYELLRYDCIQVVFGFQGILKSLERTRTRSVRGMPPTGEIERALGTACCFYLKRVWCLQRSTVLVRLLRQQGVPAEVVVGYRPVPFASHSWVEYNGRTINDSAAYQSQLEVLLRA